MSKWLIQQTTFSKKKKKKKKSPMPQVRISPLFVHQLMVNTFIKKYVRNCNGNMEKLESNI